MKSSVLLLGLFFVMVSGCTTATPETVGPYSAEQWRQATLPGQTFRYRVEVPSSPERWEREIVVSGVSDRGVRLESSTFVEDGMPSLKVAPTTTDVSWADLVARAQFPTERTKVRRAYIETDAGRFQGRVFEVRERIARGAVKVTRAWFADGVVGAPIRHEVELEGRIISRVVMVSRTL